MKSTLLSVALFTGFLSGCEVLPIQTEIKQDHFRFQNFVQNVQPDHEYIFLACHRHQPTGWSVAKQYPAGAHNIWIKAEKFDDELTGQPKVAYFNVKTTLEAGKSYMPIRKIDGKKITLWIQEVDSGKRVSDKLESELRWPLAESISNHEQCITSTV